jgi:putative ABC transport system permease protein
MYYLDNYRKPLGFSYENVWTIRISTTVDLFERPNTVFPEIREKYHQVELAIQALPEVESFAAARVVPYSDYAFGPTLMNWGTQRFMCGINLVGDNFKDVMGLQLVRGRWFDKSDDGLNFQPVVVNEQYARLAFGDEDPIGKKLESSLFGNKKPRIVGVITDFRKEGEFAALEPYAFYRASISHDNINPLLFIAVRVRAGTTRAWEEKLMAAMAGAAREWSFDIQGLSELRDDRLEGQLGLVLAWALVSGFLMLMVGLGLVGVLWQSVTQRTKEIGLRRAKGATAGDIYAQILGEIFIITSMGLIAGLLVVVQFPLLNLLGFLSGKVYIASIVVSMTGIYLLTFICGLYPSHLATKVHPAEALHYE